MKNNLVKILATLGLIIAIALILRGVFDVGKIGIKSFSNKKTMTDLPILECEFKDDVANTDYVDIYDLNELVSSSEFKRFPKNISENEKNIIRSYNKKIETRDGSAHRVTILDDKYTIKYYKNEKGIAKGHHIDIDRKTGKSEMIFPKHYIADGTFKTRMDAILDPSTKTFYGICKKTQNKNL